MKLNELISKRSAIIEEMENLVAESEAKERSMNEEELTKWNALDEEQKEIEKQINQRKAQDEINTRKLTKIQTTESKMEDFKKSDCP